MFGLMKRGPRLPYCGTCKTLGALYGQQARLLLNHNVAFLATRWVFGGTPNTPVWADLAADISGSVNVTELSNHRQTGS